MSKTIKQRMSEPSTWAGFATIILGIGQLLPAAAPIAHALAPLLGGVAVALREQGA